MAGPTLRDRFFTPRVARAITAPSGILLAGAVAAGAVLLGVPVVVAIPLGALGWAARVAAAIPRRRRGERIDPFTLQEPWRRFVQEGLQARNRFTEAVGRTRPGPLRDRLQEIADRMETGVEECWKIARRGQALHEARAGIDVADIDGQLAEIEATGAGAKESPGGTDAALAMTAESLRAQRATADRLDRIIREAHGQLRLLDARMDEAVARTLELSAQSSSDPSVASLGSDVDQLVTEMESLRAALDESNRAAQGGLTAGGEA